MPAQGLPRFDHLPDDEEIEAAWKEAEVAEREARIRRVELKELVQGKQEDCLHPVDKRTPTPAVNFHHPFPGSFVGRCGYMCLECRKQFYTCGVCQKPLILIAREESADPHHGYFFTLGCIEREHDRMTTGLSYSFHHDDPDAFGAPPTKRAAAALRG